MPYKITHENGKWYVETIDTGEKRPKDGYLTEDEAKKYLAALEANVPEAHKKSARAIVAEGGQPAVKIGAMINKSNRQRLSEVRDHANAIAEHASAMLPTDSDLTAGVNPEQPWGETGPLETRSIDPNTLINYGDAVKGVRLDNGDVKLGGYLVRFSTKADPDLTRQYFTKATDLGHATTSDCWFNHRLPVKYNGRQVIYKDKLPPATLTRDDVGVFAEIVLGARNEYEQQIADMGLAKKLSWSSGTAPHLVDVEEQDNGTEEIKAWPLGLDASLTPTPAEPANRVIPLKSLLSDNDLLTATTEQPTGAPEAVKSAASDGGKEQADPSPKEFVKMELTKEELQAMFKEHDEAVINAVKMAAPAPDTAGHVTVVTDEADRPFRSLAEQALAVKTATLSNYSRMDPRLLRIKSQQDLAIKAPSGANESIPSDAGYLVEPTIGQELLIPLHQEGPFSSLVRRLPVGANSNYGWINGIDETSRATGSRWGGVRGYRLNEGATITSSRPKFRRINWELKKYAVLMYATDELLLDAAQFNEVAKQSAGEELSFMANDDIMAGSGLGGPQGILNSGALISATRQDASKVLHADILNMWLRLLPQSKKSAIWAINPEVQPQLDALYFTGTTSVLSPYIGYRPDGVMTIYGRPVVQNEFNKGLGLAGDIVLMDPTEYLFWEKGEVQSATSIHIAFLTDEQAFRFIYRCDGQTSHYKAITPYNTNLTTTYSSFVTLTAAT